MQELKIPKECYKYSSGAEQIANECNEYYTIEALHFSEDIHLTIQDAKYKWKVYTDRDTLFAVNQVKSLFIENIKLLTKPQFILGTIYTLLNKKELNKFIKIFNRQAFRIMSPFIFKDWHLTRFSQELHKNIFYFLYGYGVEEKEADRFAEIFVHLLEYDSAYRFRIIDIMDTLSNKDFESPRKAILGLIDTIKKRDHIQIGEKYIRILKVISWGLLLPRFRKAFKIMVSCMNLENIQSDDSDKYWMCLPGTYPFMGMTNEERATYAQSRGWKYPNKLI